VLEKLTHQSSQVAPFQPLPKGNILQQQQQQPPELFHNPILDSSKGMNDLCTTTKEMHHSFIMYFIHTAPEKTHQPTSLAHHFTSHNCFHMVFSDFLVLLQDTMDWSSWVYRSNVHCVAKSTYPLCKIMKTIMFMYRRRVCVHVVDPFLSAGLVTAALNPGSV